LELELLTEEAMQSAINIQSSFLDVSHLTTAGHLPHSVLKLHHAETTTSASQVEAHQQAAKIHQFPGNHDMVEQSVCQVADKGPQKCP
jgi:hypothetical protein